MRNHKSVLDYFIRLIVSGELVSRRKFFQGLYSGAFSIEPDRNVILEYDPEREVAVYEEKPYGLFLGRYREDFGQTIREEVESEALKVKGVVFETLSSGEPAAQESFYRQLMERLEKLSQLVNKNPVFARYPCIAAALLDIKEFSNLYAPIQAEEGAVVATSSSELVIALHYKYIEKGGRTEDAALTRKRLGDLFYRVRDDLRLIDSGTSLEDFRAIFSGKVVTKPIMWMGTNKELRQFFLSIEHKLVSPARQLAPGKWGRVAACFIHRSGESFTAGQLQNTGPMKKSGNRMDEIEELGRLLL